MSKSLELWRSKAPSRSNSTSRPSLQRLQGLFGIIFLLCQAFISGPRKKDVSCCESTFITFIFVVNLSKWKGDISGDPIFRYVKNWCFFCKVESLVTRFRFPSKYQEKLCQSRELLSKPSPKLIPPKTRPKTQKTHHNQDPPIKSMGAV